MIPRYPKAVPSPAFFGSVTTTRRFLSTNATSTETPHPDFNPNPHNFETDAIESHEYDHPYLISGNDTLLELRISERALRLRMDMPGVDKKGVKTWIEDDSLHVRGIEAEAHEGVERKEYEYRYQLTSEDAMLLKLKEANAEMKNGVLRVFIPKVNLEDRKKSTIYIPIK